MAWSANKPSTVDMDSLFPCREHTARVMETVRAINAGKTSKKSRKISAQSGSTGKGGAGFNFSLADMANESRGGGEGVAHSQDGIPVPGKYRAVVNPGSGKTPDTRRSRACSRLSRPRRFFLSFL